MVRRKLDIICRSSKIDEIISYGELINLSPIITYLYETIISYQHVMWCYNLINYELKIEIFSHIPFLSTSNIDKPYTI